MVRKGDEDLIVKVKGGYSVKSESGRNLGGPYKTRAEAEKRLAQVHWFKSHSKHKTILHS